MGSIYKQPRTALRLIKRAVAAAVLATPATQFAHGNQPEIMVASASESADGKTEAVLNQALLQALENHAVDGITRKASAALAAQGIKAQFPPLKASSTYTTIGGKKLAIIKVRNAYANQVVINGIVGPEFRRVICVRTRNFEIDLPVFYGDCGATVRAEFELKGLPEPLKGK